MPQFLRPSKRLIFPVVLAALALLSFNSSWAATVVKGTGGTSLCVGAGFTTLTNIVITEAAVGDFSPGGAQTLILTTSSANFEFNTAILPGIGISGPGIAMTSLSYISATQLSIGITLFGTHATNINSITISGLQVRAITAGTIGAGINHGGTLNLNLVPAVPFFADLNSYAPPTPIIGGPTPVCAGRTGAVYSTAAVGGHTYLWSISGGTITAGAGTASITVTWGSSASGSVTVQQTNPQGCSTTTAPYNVVINPLPTPVVSGINDVCAGATGVVYTTPLVVGHTYAWTATGGTIVSGGATETVTVDWGAAGTGTVSVKQTNALTTCAYTTPNYNVTINANPTPVIAGTNTVCSSDGGLIYSTPSVGGHTYVWSITGGTITSGGNSSSATVTWGAAGAGTLTVAETITATGCVVTTAAYPVTINALPTPVISGLNTVCAGAAGVIYSVPPAGGRTYVWVIGGGAITLGAGTNSVTVTWGAAGTGTLSVTETITLTGCDVTTPNYNVTINANPTPVIAGTNTVCSADGGLIYSTPSVGGHTYVWSITGGTITSGGNSSSATVTWGAAGAGTLTVAETITATGCVVTTAAYPVTINALPTPVISGLNTVCAGAAGVIYSVPPAGGRTYVWVIGGGAITLGAGTNSVTVTWGAAGTGTLSVTETITLTGCDVTTPNYNVTINANPTPVIAGTNTVCSSDGGLIYSTPSVGGHTYVWSITGGTITSGGNSSSATVTWGAAGAGTLTVAETITATGCVVTTAAYPVTINALPTPVISGLNTVCAGAAGVIYSVPPAGGRTYVWVIGGGAITLGAGTNSVTVTWGAAGTGTLSVTETITLTGCDVTTPNYNVTINANPTPVIAGTNTVCSADGGLIYSTPSVGGHTYVWSITGGTITSGGNSSSATVTWGAAGAGTLTVAETITATGCVVTTAAYPVTINALPTPVISGLNTVCAGAAGVIYSVPPAGGRTYVWVIGGGAITLGAGTNSVTVTWGAAGTGTLSVTETITLTGCDVTTPNYNVTINANPTPVIAGTNTVCSADGGLIYSTPSVGGHTYVWSITGGTITSGGNSSSATVTWGAAGAGTLTVAETITATGCVVTTAAYPVTINALPTPVISGLNTVCAGAAGVIYSVPPAGGRTYVWVIGGGAITLGAGTNSVTVTWGAAGTGTLSVTETITLTGCDVTTPNYNVTINANPTPVIAGTNTVCSADGGLIYSTPSVGGHTYVWSITGGTITSGGNSSSATVTWGAAGAGTLTVAETITATGCVVTTAAYPVTINALPTPVISGLNTVCAGAAGVIYSVPPAGGRTYVWVIGGGAITLGAGTNSVTVMWGAAGAGTLAVTETITATGCDVTTSNYNVTINPNPTPTIAGSNTVCSNQTGVNYSTASVVGNTYSWVVSGGTVVAGAGTNSVTINWGGPGAGSITLTETITTTGCEVTTAPFGITINPSPTPVISGLNSVCANSLAVPYSTPGVGGNIYIWNIIGGTLASGAGTNSITVNWGAAGPGQIQVTELNGVTFCSATSSFYNVTINANPTPVIAGSNTVCSADIGVAYSTPFVAAHSYIWTISGGIITAGAGTNSIMVTWGGAGTGTLTVAETIAASGCSVTTSPYNVTVNPLPTPAISGLNTVCEGVTGVLYSTPLVAGRTYSWVIAGGTITAGAGTNQVTVAWGTPGTGTLSVTETITATGCDVTTGNYNVTINVNPTPTISGLVTVCSGDTGVGYSTPFVAAHTYVWTISGGIITAGAGTNIVTVTWGAAGTGTLTVAETISASGCVVTTVPYNVTVNPLPTPAISGLNTVCAGVTAVVYSTPPAAGRTYAWGITGGSITAGAGTNSITVTWGPAGSGTLSLTETIIATGCDVTTGNYNVTINANPAPVISGNPAACSDETSVIYSTPLLAGHTYVWTISGGTITAGAGTNTVTVTWGAAGTGSLTVAETITASGCVVTTAPYNVTINPVPVFTIANNTGGGTGEICSGSQTSITLTSPTPGAVLTLQNVNYGAVTGGLYALGGTFATGATITESAGGLINPTNAPITVTYIVRAATVNCTNLVPQQTDVIVNPTPAMTINNTTASICSGNAVDITLNSVTSGATITLNSVNYGAASGTITPPQTYASGSVITESITNTTNGPVTVIYSFSVSANGCTTAGPFTTNVTVNAIPTVAAVPLNSSLCSGQATSITLSNPNALTGGVVYNWTASVLSGNVSGHGPGSGTPIAQSLTTDNLGGTVRYSIQATGNTGGCVGPAISVDVVVKPIPDAFVNVTSTNSLCSGAVTNVILENPNSVSGTTFNWSSSVILGSVGGHGPGSGTIISQTLTTIPSGGTVRYSITPVSNGCFGTPVTWDVVVNPVPVWTSEVQAAVCSNTAFSFNPSLGNGVATSFNWTAAYDPGLTGGVASGSGAVTGNLTNITGGVLNAIFTITPTATGPGTCVGPQFTITVPVNPRPVGNTLTVASVCSDLPFSYNPQAQISNGVSSTFIWNATYDLGLTGGAASGSGPLTGTLTNDTGGTLNAVYTISPTSAAGCAGTNFVITIPILSEPKGTNAAAPIICSDASVNYNLQANVTSTNGVVSNFLWQAAANANVTGESTTSQSGPVITDVLTNITGGNEILNYTVTPTSVSGCVGNTFVITVTVKSKPVGTGATIAAVCSGTPFNYAPIISNGMPSTFTWTAMYGAGLSGGAGSGTGNVAETLTNTSATSATASYSVVATSGGCVGSPFTINVPILPQPTGINQSVAVCSNDPVNTLITLAGSSPAASSFTISNVPNGLTPISGINSGSGLNATELLDDVWENVGSLPVNVVYTIIPYNGACVGTAFTITATINPQPVGVDQPVVQCSDQAINYNLLNNISLLGNNVGSTFSWVATPNANVTGESTIPQSSSLISDAINNITNGDEIVTYVVTPTAVTGCVGNTFQIDVTIHPEPVGTSTAAPKICSGSAVNYALQPNINGVNGVPSTFVWKGIVQPNVSGTSTFFQTTATISDVLVNLTFTPQTVQYKVVPTGINGCAGDTLTISVTINPKAVVSAGPDLASCADIPNPQLQGVITYAPAGVQWSSSSTGTSGFSPLNDPMPNYSYVPGDISISPTLTITALDPDGPGPGNPCLAESDIMVLDISPLPNVPFFGLPPSAAENDPIISLSATQAGGLFTISPAAGLGTTTVGPGLVDIVDLDPSAATLGLNQVTYTFTDVNSCTNSSLQNIFINPVTTISFHIDGSSVNGMGQQELCANQGDVHITTSHGGTAGLLPYTRLFAVPAYVGQVPPVGMVFTDGSTEPDGSQRYFVHTAGLPSDLYAIEYDFENTSNAKTQIVVFVRIFAAPTAIMDVPNHCISSAINFTDLSTLPSTTLPNAPPAPVIDRWIWDFDDGTANVTVQNPSHLYTAPGIYDVSLTVITNSPQNCFNTVIESVQVGALPAVEFSWSAICNNDSTKFKDETALAPPSIITNYTWDFGDGHVVSGPAGVTMPIGTDGGFTSGTYNDPSHKYPTFSNYTAQLTIDTDDGCSSTLPKNLFTLAYTTVTPLPGAAYSEDFEASPGGWQVEPINNPIDPISWQWGIPTGPLINAAAGSTNAWWTGAHPQTNPDSTAYYSNEQTVVNGPCFDLSQLTRPMLALDYWVDTQKNFDGAVLQFSVDGGNTWQNVGVPDEGINWYTRDAIISNPGQQLVQQYGWTGQSGRWLNARANLDTIPTLSRTQVRIRLAFSSDATTPPTAIFDGFAFDNVFVGEKRRNVLIEHFTNANLLASVNADAYLDNLYSNELALRGITDFHDIRYHLSFPSPDPLFTDNPDDPGARALFMSVPQPPFSIMDGKLDSYFNGTLGQGGINDEEIDRRALVDPKFTLSLTATPGSTSNQVNIQFDITADTIFNGPLLAQVALVEWTAGTSNNVLRKLLLGSDGQTINQSWTVPGPVFPITRTDIGIDVPLTNGGALTMIGFIQDKNTKEIYQSVVIKSPAVPALTGSTITGITEPHTFGPEEIQMFPNPANGNFQFGLPDKFPAEYTWQIADQRGVVVLKGDFSGIVADHLPVDVAELPNGVYFVVIGAPEKASIHKKLIVMNRN